MLQDSCSLIVYTLKECQDVHAFNTRSAVLHVSSHLDMHVCLLACVVSDFFAWAKSLGTRLVLALGLWQLIVCSNVGVIGTLLSSLRDIECVVRVWNWHID